MSVTIQVKVSNDETTNVVEVGLHYYSMFCVSYNEQAKVSRGAFTKETAET